MLSRILKLARDRLRGLPNKTDCSPPTQMAKMVGEYRSIGISAPILFIFWRGRGKRVGMPVAGTDGCAVRVMGPRPCIGGNSPERADITGDIMDGVGGMTSGGLPWNFRRIMSDYFVFHKVPENV